MSSTSNALTENGSYALGSTGVNQASITLENYGFAIPSTATIRGIEAVAGVKATESAVGGWSDTLVRLSDETGTSVSDNKASSTTIGTSHQEITWGGPTDMWGYSWTPAIINDIDFSIIVFFSKSGGAPLDSRVEVDYIKIKIYYDPK